MIITSNGYKFLVFYERMYNLCNYLTYQCVFFFLFFSQIMQNFMIHDLILRFTILLTFHDPTQDPDFDNLDYPNFCILHVWLKTNLAYSRSNLGTKKNPWLQIRPSSRIFVSKIMICMIYHDIRLFLKRKKKKKEKARK